MPLIQWILQNLSGSPTPPAVLPDPWAWFLFDDTTQAAMPDEMLAHDVDVVSDLLQYPRRVGGRRIGSHARHFSKQLSNIATPGANVSSYSALNELVSLPDYAAFAGGEWSCTAWFYRNPTESIEVALNGSGTVWGIFSTTYNGADPLYSRVGVAAALEFNSLSSGTNNGTFRATWFFWTGAALTIVRHTFTTYVAPFATWTHLGIRKRVVSGIPVCDLFIDGEYHSTGTPTSSLNCNLGSFLPPTSNLGIGCRRQWNVALSPPQSISAVPLNLTLEDLRIWQSALTNQQFHDVAFPPFKGRVWQSLEQTSVFAELSPPEVWQSLEQTEVIAEFDLE